MIQFIFCGKINFEDDGAQICLVFQPTQRYLKNIVNTDRVLEWKSKGLSDESIKAP